MCLDVRGRRAQSQCTAGPVSQVPMAWLIGTMTEELAKHTGETIGGLINATFGNIVEMLLCVSGTGVRN